MYDKIVVQYIKNCTKNNNVPRNNSHKSAGTKIEYSYLYISELVEKFQNIGFLEEITGQFLLGGMVYYYINIW